MNTLRSGGAPVSERGFVQQVIQVLRPYLSEPNSRAAVTACAAAARVDVEQLTPGHIDMIVSAVERSLDLFNVSRPIRAECLEKLRAAARDGPPSSKTEVTIRIADEEDVFRARAIAKELCARLGLGDIAMTKVITALSELGRNILQYAGTGKITIRALPQPASGVEVVAADYGPGIADLAKILAPGFRSRTGMGVGLRGTRNLMDSFDVQTAPGRGTTVTIRKLLSPAWRAL